MSRSVWKGKFVDISVLKSVFFMESLSEYNILQVWSRRSVILPDLIGRLVDVYNGKRFVRIRINKHMIGHKFGEFAYTKRMGNLIHFANSSEKKKTESQKVLKPQVGLKKKYKN